MSRKTPPLNPQLPMVDPNTGQPTPFFMQWWQEQIRSNAAIPDVSTPAAVSAILDVITGGTEGAVLYRGNEIWEILVPGTDGQILTTQGIANPPTWGNISNVLDKTLTDGTVWGNVLFRGETGWEVLAPGTDGQGLVTRGPDADIEWGDVSSELVSAALFLEKRESVQGTWTFANTVQEGDLIVLFGSTDVENGVAKLISGFTQIDVRADSSPSAIGQYKKITAGDLPFASVAMPDFGSSTHNVQWVGMHFRGAGDVVATVPGRVDGSGTSIQPPDITTTEDFSLVVIMGGLDDDPSAVITHPAGFTTATADYGAFNSKSMMAAGVFETAGLVEPDPFLSSLSDGWTAMTVAFGPGPFVPVTKWIELSDTPGSITADAMVVGDSGGTGLDMVTLSDYLDARLGSAHGNILQRGSTGWEVVAPGTDGTILATNGSSADVAWEALTNLLDDLGTTQGAIAYRNAAQWVILPPGTSGEFLQTQGPSANPQWAAGGGGGGGASAINDLSDVDTATVAPTDGQALVWSAADSEWQPGTVSGGGSATTTENVMIEEVISETDLSVTSITTSSGIVISNSDDYDEIIVEFFDVAGTLNYFQAQVSPDGTTWRTSGYTDSLTNHTTDTNNVARNGLLMSGQGTSNNHGRAVFREMASTTMKTSNWSFGGASSSNYMFAGHYDTAEVASSMRILTNSGSATAGRMKITGRKILTVGGSGGGSAPREVVQNIVPDNTVTEYVIDISGHEDIELFIANTTALASGIMRFALSADGGSTRQNLDWGVVGTSQVDGHPTAQVEIANRSSLVGYGPVRGAIRNHRLSAVPTTFELHRRDSGTSAYRYDGGTDAAAETTHLIIESTGGNWTAGQIAVTGIPVSAPVPGDTSLTETVIASTPAVSIALPAAYKRTTIHGWVRPATDGSYPRVRFSTDDGATFESGAADYGWKEDGGNDQSDSFIRMHAFSAGSGANERADFTITMYDLQNSTEYTYVRIEGSRVDTSGNINQFLTVGVFKQDTIPTHIQITMDSGNIAAGKVAIEGG